MDTEKVLRLETISPKDARSFFLSYRSYERLTDSQKREFNMIGSSYPPIVRKWVLFMVRRTKTLKRSYWRIANRLLKRNYLSELESRLLKEVGVSILHLSDDKVIKELTFMGWLKLKDYTHSCKLSPRYGYFITNRPLGSDHDIFIFPQKFADTYDRYTRSSKVDYLTYLNGNVHGGIPGFIRYKYSLYINNSDISSDTGKKKRK